MFSTSGFRQRPLHRESYRRAHKMGEAWVEKLTEKAVWHVVREYATKAGIDKLAPHDLRRPVHDFATPRERIAADPVSTRSHFHSDNRTISRLQTAHSRYRQRKNRNRAVGLSEPLRCPLCRQPIQNPLIPAFARLQQLLWLSRFPNLRGSSHHRSATLRRP